MKRIIFTIFMIMIFPGIVLADNVSLNCPSEVNQNTEYTCSLSGYTDSGVFSLGAKVIVSGNVEFIGFVTNRDLWQGDGANGDVQLYREDNVTSSFLIGTIKLKSTNNSDNVVTVESITFFNENGDEVSVNPISRIIKVKSNSSEKPPETTKKSDNTTTTKKPSEEDTQGTTKKPEEEDTSPDNNVLILNDLIVEGYELDFYIDTHEYTLAIGDESELVITPIVEDTSIKYEILDNENLVNGSVIRIVLNDDDGNTGEYTITIEKEDTVSPKKNYSLIFIIIIGILVAINIIRIVLSKRKGSVN